MPEAASDAELPQPWQRWIMLLLLAVVAAHSVALALWLAPTGPVRDAIGQRSLAAYVDPYFEQSWSTLSPSAQEVDESFRVRAVVEQPSGKQRVTDWVDVTASSEVEASHDPSSPRAHLAARRLATNLNAALLALTPEQRGLVRVGYVSRPLSVLEHKMRKSAGSEAGALRAYLVVEQMVVRFASMYAGSRWDDTIAEVQVRVGRRAVPTGGLEKEPLADVHYRWMTVGWRSAFDAPYEAQTAFDSQVKK